MEIKTEQFLETARKELQNAYSQQFLQQLLLALTVKRQAAYASFPDPAAVHAYGQKIRGEAVQRMPELLEAFEEKAKANGAVVFWARDSREANSYILELARSKGVRYVAKGKSMITEELGLNDALAGNGIEAWETDLGEFIAQLMKRPPFHIVGPVINIPVQEICDAFLEKGVLDEPSTDPATLGYAARRYLREKFHHVEMGVTGVNIAVAETGTIINVENEGNIRLTKAGPRVQVSVMSLEKVVPTLSDAMHMLRVLCRSCTGQSLGAYVTMDSGPKKRGEIDGPEELYIVILDNGRSQIYQDPLTREALRCIRCGACLNACPVYGKIGGYAYGWAYSGPMGQVLSPLLLGLDRTEHLFQACTLCQRCKTLCPAGIDHPRLLLYYRSKNLKKDKNLKGAGVPLPERAMYRAAAATALHPPLWRLLAKALQWTEDLSAPERLVPPAVRGWKRSRDLPKIPKKTFRDLWRELERE